jgi:elongation factor G
MKAYIYDDEVGEKFHTREILAEEQDQVEEYRNLLLEKLSEYNDVILEKYLEGKEIEEDEIRQTLRQLTISNQVVPVLCGSSFKNKGVQMLLDAIVRYLPSPVDIPPVKGIDPATGQEEIRTADSDNTPLCALAYKIAVDPYVGKLTYFRIYSGQLKLGSYVLNSRQGKKERITKILRMHANHREEIEEAQAGDIVAGVGLRYTVTGDTLCSEYSPLVLESMSFPEPVIDVAIEPRTKADQDKIGESLRRLAEEDPTFKTRTDAETGQTIISGMGELHLEIIIDRLLREFKVNANVGKPQVSYKETIKNSARAEAKFDRQTGGRGQYGHVVLEITPLEEGRGKEFNNLVRPEVISGEFIPAVKTGVYEALQAGILAGYMVDDIQINLIGGSYHEVDSTEQAFKIAASMALKEALGKAQPVLLEPIMDIEIISPDEYVGDVIADMNARRGKVLGFEENRDSRIIKGTVPLAETFGYATALRSASQGRATFTMKIKNFAEVPESRSKEIIARRYGLPLVSENRN